MRRPWPPAALVLSALIALWLSTGVTPAQIATFGGYELALVLAPGWLLYRAIAARPSGLLTQFVIGWTLGYLVEVASFVATAAVGARGWLPACQVLVAVASAVVWRRRDRRELRPAEGAGDVGAARPTAGWGWAISGLSLAVLACLGLQYFAPNPLPTRVGSVTYPVDFVWELSLAAEALHHWPVSDPTVAGTPLYYHLFATFDTAAAAQVTGLSLPVVFFRLSPVVPALLAVLTVSMAGRALIRRAWAGPIAAGLLLLVSEINVDLRGSSQFGNELADDVIWQSPSFLFGLLFFVPALVIVHDRVTSYRDRFGPRHWVLLVLLLVGCATAKAPSLPVLAGGLVVYLAVAALRGTPLRRLTPPIAATALAVAAYGAFWIVQYRHAGAYGLTLKPPGAVRQMDALARLAPGLGTSAPLKGLFWVGAAALGLFAAYGPVLAGLPWACVRRRAGRFDQGRLLLLSLLVVGAVPYLAFTAFGVSQVYFVEYGLVAGALLSAAGISELWQRARQARRFSLLVAGVFAVLLVTLSLATEASRPGRSGFVSHVMTAVSAVLLVVVVAVHLAGRRRPSITLVAVLALVTAGGVSRALTVAGPPVLRLDAGQPLSSNFGTGLTAGLRQGLFWIRDHTPTAAVLAVNNNELYTVYRNHALYTPAYYYYSAFAERRVFLEGWLYTQRAFDLGETGVFLGRKLPFAARLRLNDQVFDRADSKALCVLARRYGVRYLVVDRVHGRATRLVARLGTKVYGNRSVTIYRTTGLCSTRSSTTGRPTAEPAEISRSTMKSGRPFT